MILLKRAMNALSLLYKLDFHEFVVRFKIFTGQIDLNLVSTEDLNLSPDRCNYYSNSGGSQLERVIAALNVTPEDAIIDFGCGKGGALITLSKFAFCKIAGVEISEELVRIARMNLQKLDITNVEIYHTDATKFAGIDDFNYVYFFNPFPCGVMGSVIELITESLRRIPRNMTIIYLNPVCHQTVISNSPFVKVAEFPHHLHSYYVYSNKETSPSGAR